MLVYECNTDVSVEGEGLQPVTWVLIEDVNSGEWGLGGKPVTAEDLHKISEQVD